MFGRTALATLALSLALSPGLLAAEKAQGKDYGKGVTLKEATPIRDILNDPEAYKGKPVRIEGQVMEVCAMAGCWMELKQGEASIRVRVEDGVIVFPKTAKGQTAVAEGTIEMTTMPRDKYVEWQKHHMEEQGAEFEPSIVGNGPFNVVELRGTGAVIPE